MSERTPIKFRDIWIGDLVERVHSLNGVTTSYRLRVASLAERGTVANSEGERVWNDSEAGAEWFLLDRPTPKVDLPTEPTLGWMTFASSGQRLGWFGPTLKVGWEISELDSDMEVVNHYSSATSFTPAVAVPKAALDELIRLHENDGWERSGKGMTDQQWFVAVGSLLTAVDEANGAIS